MSDNTMPERITQRDARHCPVEYIRADVAQAQLDAANKRIAELEAEYRLHKEASLADFLNQSDEHNAEIERLKSRVAFDCRQLLAERDARIAELEAAQAWVSVDERLPELNQAVQVYTDWEIHRNQSATWGKDICGNSRWIGATGTVTHWMPLPPPPVTPDTP